MGLTIVTGQWNGIPLDRGSALAGPRLLIRKPAWTTESPSEDIPIMIFTVAEWRPVATGGVAVSAAFLGPSELGHNSNLVFALPRWDFDNLPGAEEMGKLLQDQTLPAPCGNAGGS